MSLSDNYPDIRPLWMNDYANAGVIDPRCSFARSDSTPSNVHYWSDEDHVSSENLLLQSQDLDTTWTVFPGTPAVTGGQTAPDGTTTAWVVTAQSASSAISQAQQSVSSVGATKTYTLSAYLKAGTASHTYMTLRGSGSTYGFVEIDWSDPLNLRVEKRTFSSASATVTAVGSGGWYRVALTTTTDASTSSGLVYIGPTDGTTQNANGYPVWNSSGETAIAWGVQLEERGSATAYNATTTQIHREYAATLKSVAYSGQPRFEYEPTGDRSARGLLIESQAQNLATYSSDISNAAWSKTRTSVEASAAIGPDGTLSASLIRDEPSTNNTHYVYQLLPSIASGTVVTASVFAKAAGRTFLIIQNGSTSPFGGASYKVWFNLTSGTVGTISGSGVTASATDCGNGWTRCTVTFPASTVTGTHALQINSSEGDNDQYHVGDSYSGVLLFGAQYEQNSFPSSYIATSGSASTRTADSLSVATADIGYTGGDTSVVGEFSFLEDEASPVGSWTAAPRLFAITDGEEELMVYRNVTDGANTLVANVEVSSTDYNALVTTVNTGAGVNYKVGMSVQSGSIKGCMDGGFVATNTSAILPGFSSPTLLVGSLTTTQGHMNGHCKKLAIYSEVLTDTNLQALTS